VTLPALAGDAPRVLIVDDETGILESLRILLKNEGFIPFTAHGGRAGVERIPELRPDIVLTDVRMPDVSGVQVLSTSRQVDPDVPVILMTAQATLQSAMQAVNEGAFYYIQKPFRNDELLAILRRAAEHRKLRAENTTLKQEIKRRDRTTSARPIGRSKPWLDVLRLAETVAPTDSTVLITGESGTGKELVASALHRHSPRAAKPLIAINTAAIPKDLLESELFGHERGSFTGAQNMRRGRFEQADGGTLFLDEIGDMPPDLQTRLLRVLSDGQFYRVGGHQPIRANVRVIAATHQDLEARVKLGLFREDLFHRLNVIRIRLPPLRERREDIPLLARHFLAKSARELGVEPKRLSESALKFICAQDFPGNVRQIENVCHWVTVMAAGVNIEINDMPSELRADASAAPEQNWASVLEREVTNALNRGESGLMGVLGQQFEKSLILRALAHTGGRRIEAAHLLGLGRNTLTRKIQELGLDADKRGNEA